MASLPAHFPRQGCHPCHPHFSELPPGTYSLILLADGLFACQGQERFWVGDGEAVVEVVVG
jgi:hypothetical protein